MIAVPADAAVKISNGVACKKSGQTTKTSGGTYRCAKNPLVSSTKLTWLSLDCLSAANDAVKARTDSTKTLADFKAQIPVIDFSLQEQKAVLATIQAKLNDANTRLPLAQAKISTAKTPADKAEFEKAVRLWTAASRAYASQVRQIEGAIKRLESARLIAVNKPIELAASIADARDSAKLICTKGF
jgi:predicted  nucleic acid-binding Zn-ribbon protein